MTIGELLHDAGDEGLIIQLEPFGGRGDHEFNHGATIESFFEIGADGA